jgi:hypothetical protein
MPSRQATGRQPQVGHGLETEMLSVVLGAILGTFASLAIAHFYYSRSTRDLKAEVNDLREQLAALRLISVELQDSTEAIARSTEITKRHVVAGTIDDPEFPYK